MIRDGRTVLNPRRETLEGDGRKSNSPMAHYCWDWDDLLIDENCEEFELCHCGLANTRY